MCHRFSVHLSPFQLGKPLRALESLDFGVSPFQRG
jgi:hypothetical protein